MRVAPKVHGSRGFQFAVQRVNGQKGGKLEQRVFKLIPRFDFWFSPKPRFHGVNRRCRWSNTARRRAEAQAGGNLLGQCRPGRKRHRRTTWRRHNAGVPAKPERVRMRRVDWALPGVVLINRHCCYSQRVAVHHVRHETVGSCACGPSSVGGKASCPVRWRPSPSVNALAEQPGVHLDQKSLGGAGWNASKMC